MKKKRKFYDIKCTIWEYYQVEACTKKEALSKATEDPFFIDCRNKEIVKVPPFDD